MPFQEEPVHALHVTSPALVSLTELPARYIQRLQRVAFTTASEIILTRPESLKSKTGLSAEEVQDVYGRLSDLCSPTPRTVLELVSKSYASHITLGSPELDRLFGASPAGIPTGQLTEIAGESTSGKTCMSLQLSLNVQLPMSLGGLLGGCVYLCTESAFPSARLYEMAGALCEKLNNTGAGHYHSNQADAESYSKIAVDALMANVHLLRVQDSQTLIHTIHYSLPVFLERQNNPECASMPIRLVVLDSIGAIFRTDLEQSGRRDSKARMTERAGEMNQVADGLKFLASRHHLAVVIVNQVSDVIDVRSNLHNSAAPPSRKSATESNVREESRSSGTTQINHGESTPSTIPSLRSTAEASSASSPNSSAGHDTSPLPLLYHPQAYHFSGQAITENRKEAALGLAWTSAINGRIMLHRLNRELEKPPNLNQTKDIEVIKYSTVRVREARLVFSPFGQTPLDENGRGVQYVIESSGIVAAKEYS